MEQLYASWLSDAGYGEITRIEALSGGCINNTARLQLDSGLSVILKVNNSAPADFFHAEAAGLAASVNDKPSECRRCCRCLIAI